MRKHSYFSNDDWNGERERANKQDETSRKSDKNSLRCYSKTRMSFYFYPLCSFFMFHAWDVIWKFNCYFAYIDLLLSSDSNAFSRLLWNNLILLLDIFISCACLCMQDWLRLISAAELFLWRLIRFQICLLLQYSMTIK